MAGTIAGEAAAFHVTDAVLPETETMADPGHLAAVPPEFWTRRHAATFERKASLLASPSWQVESNKPGIGQNRRRHHRTNYPERRFGQFHKQYSTRRYSRLKWNHAPLVGTFWTSQLLSNHHCAQTLALYHSTLQMPFA